MKTNYLKSIGLIVLGGMIASFNYHYFIHANLVSTEPEPAPTYEECSTVPSQSNLSAVIKKKYTARSGEGSSKVSLGRAEQGSALYRLWLRYVPNCFKIQDSKMVFISGTINPDDLEIIDSLRKDYDTLHQRPTQPDNIYPFIGQKNYAVFISRSDIDSAFKDYDKQHLQRDPSLPALANGIRVYTGVKDLSSLDRKKIGGHLFVVPTYLESDTARDFILKDEQGQYVYDLTTPCPAYCDSTSELNNLTIE